MIKSTSLAALISVVLSSVAYAQGGMGAPQEAFVPDVSVESFIYQFPAKSSPFSTETDSKKVTMVFPTGQSPKKWKESLLFTEYSTTAGATSAAQVKDLRTNANSAKCASFRSEDAATGGGQAGRGGPGGGERPEGMGGPERSDEERPEGMGGRGEGRPGGTPPNASTSAMENGYSMASWTEYCTNEKGETLVTANKVILGNEKLYSVTKTWKKKPKASNMQTLQAYFRNVYVCDPRTGANPCTPPGGGPRGGR